MRFPEIGAIVPHHRLRRSGTRDFGRRPLGGPLADAGAAPMMPIQSRSAAAVAAGCGDVLAIVSALWLAYLLRGLDDADRYMLVGVVAVLLYLLVATGASGRRRAHTLTGEFRATLGAWALTLGGLLAIGWMTKLTGHYSRVAIGLWALFAAFGLLAWRAVRHLAKRLMRSYRQASPVAIAGVGGQASRFARLLQSEFAPEAPLEGFFAEHGADGAAEGLPAPLLGDFRVLAERAARREFSAVFIALSASEEDTVRRLVATLSDTSANVYVVPTPFTDELVHAQWVNLGRQPLVSVFETPFVGINGWVKRAEDIVLACAALAVAAVPMLLIAAAVKVTSPGPVLFRQRRLGIDGRVIRVVKFRTMTVVQDGRHIQQAVANDPRLSPIGALLRRTSLDELPQFFNVLRGDMSVVGPRPHALAHNEHYRRLIPGYMLRHRIKPGITGWAQIHGLRGKTDTVENMERRVDYDLWYVDRWSVWLDLWIVARSVPLLAGDRNAD